MKHDASIPLRRPIAIHDCMELAGVVLLLAVVFLSVPLLLGRIGLSWDALNHHIYLGWIADSSRFDKDYLAASMQSTQFPYLYWPLYRLAIANVSGVVAGSVLALLHLFAVPPVWWVARTLLPQEGREGVVLRVAAVALAFMSAVPLKTLEATANDFLAAIPVLWAVAFALHAAVATGDMRTRQKQVLVAGLFAGVAVACKLSNGPLVVLLPIVFLVAADSWGTRMRMALRLGVGAIVGFLAAYGYWGWQLWSVFGNPVFPFYDGVFAPLRAAVGWTQ